MRFDVKFQLSCIATIALLLATPAFAQQHDGQRDFDFNIGTWKTHVSRLVHPLSGSHTWTDYDGTSLVRTVWNGRANLLELDVTGPAGHIQSLGLRLYNPKTHQWNLNWATSSAGVITPPAAVGEFKDGIGEFIDDETLDGKPIRVRGRFFDITPNASRFEQAFSGDGGKTWETNWTMTFDRIGAAKSD